MRHSGSGVGTELRFRRRHLKPVKRQIEEVGEKLRGMMPWIGKNKLADKTKN